MNNLDYLQKIGYLFCIADGLSAIRDARKVHKDLNILIFDKNLPFIRNVSTSKL